MTVIHGDCPPRSGVLLRHHSPQTQADLTLTLRQPRPLSSRGLRPFGYTSHAAVDDVGTGNRQASSKACTRYPPSQRPASITLCVPPYTWFAACNPGLSLEFGL